MSQTTTNTLFYLGVDGGGTKTTAVITDAQGHVLGMGHGGPVNISWVGPDVAADSTRQAVSTALRSAGILPSAVTAAYLGMASVGGANDQNRVVFVNTLVDLGLSLERTTVDNDAFVGMAAAIGISAGVGVVAGTGFTAVAIAPDGRRIRSPWYVAGRGSGHILGRQAVMAALFDLYRAGEATALTSKVLQRLALADAQGLEKWLAVPRQSWDLGQLAPTVTEAADEGDRLAIDMLRTAGMEYGLAAVFVARLAGFGNDPVGCKVATIGGVFRAGAWVTDPMEAVIKGSGIEAELVAPFMPPAGGALVLAWNQSSVAVNAEIIERLASELNTYAS